MPAAPDDPAKLAGLFAAYRGLDADEADAAFWRRDAARQIELIRAGLLAGLPPELGLERWHGLARHVADTPEMESLFAYALLRQGQPLAARTRMELLTPAERSAPEPALYYAIILGACGEKKSAQISLRRALAAPLPPVERLLAMRTEKTL
jgi:hypothetical protein